MDTNMFVHFLAVAEKGSFAQAAKELQMTPQGLGGSIRRLESELDVQLLESNGGHYRLTPYGRVFKETAQTVDLSLREMRRTMLALKAHENNIVKLGCSIGLVGYLGEEAIESYNESDGPCQVLVTDELPDLLCERRLLDGEYDFGLLTNPVDNPQLICVPIVEDHQFFWVNRRDPLAGRKVIEPADLAGRTVFSVNDEYRGTSIFLRLCEEAGVRANIRFTGEMIRIYEQARLGRGLGLTCRNHIEATSDSTTTVGIPFPALPWGFSICYLAGTPLTAEKAHFLEYMRSRRRIYR